MKITKISNIFTNFEEFHIPYGEHEYTAEIFRRYGKSVIAYKITEKSCLILLKGKRKFFLLKLSPDLKTYKRVSKRTSKNLSGNLEGNLVITNKNGYNLFIKKEVINILKD